MRHALSCAAAALTAFALFCGAAAAQGLDEEEVARAYVRAYSAADWDALAQSMSDDFVLADMTNPDPSFLGEFQGPEASLAMLRAFGAQNGVRSLGLDFPSVFASNGVVVFVGTMDVLGCPPGADSGFRWSSRIVTVITVSGGKVVRHEDFADYGGAQSLVVDCEALE